MRRAYVIALISTLMLNAGGVTVAAQSSLIRRGPAQSARLEFLGGLSPTAQELVLVTGDAAVFDEAFTASDVGTIEIVEEAGVAAVVGTPEEIRILAGRPGIAGLYPNHELEMFSESALTATGVVALRRNENLSVLRDRSGLPYDGSGVSIAVIDSGIDATHEMFVRDGETKVDVNLRQVCPWPSDDEADPPDGCGSWIPLENTDFGGVVPHGTSVAAVAAGYERTTPSGAWVSGVAPGARLVGLGAGFGLQTFNVVSAMNWVLEHHENPCGDGSCPPIRVVNNSWGWQPDGYYNPDNPVNRLVSALVDAGIVVVFGAGNDEGDGSAGTVSDYAINPLPGVISAANYYDGDFGDQDVGVNYESSRGRRGDPATYPDLSAPGTEVLTACPTGPPSGPNLCELPQPSRDGEYQKQDGSSFSAPHVAGVVALLLDADPSLRPPEVEDILEDTAHPFGDASEYIDDVYLDHQGVPRGNADHQTSYRAGHGLVDAVAALSRVLARGKHTAPPTCKKDHSPSISVIDAVGDGFFPSAAHEIERVDAHWPRGSDTLELTLELSDLLAVPIVREYFELHVVVDGSYVIVFLDRTSAGSHFGVFRGDVAVSGTLDTQEDVIRASVKLGASFGAMKSLGGLQAFSSFNEGALVMSDRVYGACSIWR